VSGNKDSMTVIIGEKAALITASELGINGI